MKSSGAPAARKEALLLRSLLPLYVVVFTGFVGYSLMITVFTPMLLRADRTMLPPNTSIAHRTILLGTLLCLYPLGQFIGSPILGVLSDRLGRRRVLLSSLAVTTLCYALIALAIGADNLALLALTCFITGLSEANVVLAQSAVADVVCAQDRNRYFGYIYMAASLAYIIGPLGGGKLTDPQLLAWFSNATPFWAVFILLVITNLATLILFRETRSLGPPSAGSLTEGFTSLRLIVTDQRLRRFYGVNLLLYVAIFGFFRSYPMYLVDEFRLNESRISEFIAWVGLPIVLANLWFTGFLSAHLRTKTVTAWSAALTGAFMIAVILPQGQAGLWPVLFLAAAALAVCLPSSASLLSNAATPAEQGRAMGNNQAIQVGAEALSGLAAGLMAAIIVKLPLIVLGMVSLAAATLVLVAI